MGLGCPAMRSECHEPRPCQTILSRTNGLTSGTHSGRNTGAGALATELAENSGAHGNLRDRKQHCEQDRQRRVHSGLTNLMASHDWLRHLAIRGCVIALALIIAS